MLRCVVCVSLLIGLNSLYAQESAWDNNLTDKLSSRMQSFVTEGQISGAVGLVMQDQVQHVTITGLADIATKRPMARDTIFRVASMTKLVTATGLMQLVSGGRIGLDDPVSKYIPTFRNAKLQDGTVVPDVTVRQVLTHTAGLANNSGLNGERTLAAEVDALGARPLQFVPGTKWQYSSGLTVAGRLIEIVSGQPYDEYLRKQIFEPLGVKDTAFQLTESQAQRLATTYKPGTRPGELVAVEIPDPRVARLPNPSGGLYSTADDMAKFYGAVLAALRGHETPIDGLTSFAKAMVTPQTGELVTGFTPGNAWGLGWCVLQQPQGVTRLLFPGTCGHGGAWGTQGWIDVRRNMVLLLLIQRTEFGNSDGSDVRDAFNEATLTSYRGHASESAVRRDFLAYTATVELRLGTTSAVVCPEAGGRVLTYSIEGQNMLLLDDRERDWVPGNPAAISAGRFDVGPELVTPPHPVLWSGPWTAEITGPAAVRLVSARDAATGLQLMRDFELQNSAPADATADTAAAHVDTASPRFRGATLVCRQTMMNVGTSPVETCHWGRSFSPGGGICLIPLGTHPSRFPARYVMYEEGTLLNVRNTDPLIRERDGFLEILGPPRKPKLGFDSYAGWLGYLMPGNHLLIKRFPTYPDRVYNEVAGLTVSVWYPQSGAVIELEPIGPRERLAPGQVATFTESWSVAEYPYPATDSRIDLPALRKLVEGTTAGTSANTQNVQP